MAKILVIGGGVNGIGTALSLLQKRPEYDVTVVSEKYSPNTTSDIAAGMWAPSFNNLNPDEKIREWSSKTWDLFLEWLKYRNKYGVSVTYGNKISDQQMKQTPWKEIGFGYNDLSQDQLRKFGSKYLYGVEFTTIFAEASKFLPQLENQIMNLGGKLVRDKIASLQDAVLKYKPDIVMNCSGLASYSLVPDLSVYPIRGQVYRVKAPWQKTFLYDESKDSFAYILPNLDNVVVGGTNQEADSDCQVRQADSETIWRNATNLCPSIKNAEMVREVVGLRPGRRKGIRVELGDVVTERSIVPVVHNYGHGANGISLFWGTSQEAADIAIKKLDQQFMYKASL